MRIVKDSEPKGLEAMADALNSISTQIMYLGTGKNGSLMGAMEFLAIKTNKGLESVADAIRELADAIDRLPRDRKDQGKGPANTPSPNHCCEQKPNDAHCRLMGGNGGGNGNDTLR